MSRFTIIQPELLPRMQVLESISTEDIIGARMGRFKAIWLQHDPPNAAQYDVDSLEFDPIKINQECCTYFELMLRDRINQAAKAVTLAFGSGSDLDAIASRYPGGVPRLPDESDGRYRRRVWLSVNAFTPHGTAEAYQFWALSALEGALKDTSTVRIRPSLEENPTIVISCMLDGPDPRPTTHQLLEVRRYIQDHHRLGFTDVISVQAPKVKEIDYRIGLRFYPGPDAGILLQQVQDSVAKLIENQYWLGVDHTIMAIDDACALAGVHSTVIEEPTGDVNVEPDWVVKVNNVDIRLIGRTE
jgi:phage-related baseplate assembly protein